ncbi:ATP-binding protein [Hydrogenophaga laconesensis]
MNARALEIELKLPQGNIWVNADEVRLIQVLQNLLSNATKFTPEGGRVEVRVSVEQEHLRVEVADNGVGMSAQTLDDVFQLFSQGEGVRETHQPGLGIGLALARSIVEMHGGIISAASAGPGKGSVFSFELPGAQLQA